MAYIYNLVDTWNDAATTFHGIKLTVTNTASGANSRLIELLDGANSKFSVEANGAIRFGVTSAFSSRLVPNGNTSFNITCYGSTVGGFGAVDNPKGLSLSTDSGLCWTNGQGVGLSANTDLRLYRDAAAQMAQRNGTNPQAFSIYNTYTDGSNYERVSMGWNGNIFEIRSQAAGTGAVRSVRFTGTILLPAGTGSANISAYGSGTSISGDNGLRLNGYNGTLELTLNNAATNSRVLFSATKIDMTSLPTTDPAVEGRLWNDAGTLKVSTGG